MRFLDPMFLWGLGALVVPLVLHLLLRRRVPVLDFPLTRLVMRAELSRQPRKRLNRVLLLIARAAILSLLALALARATFGGGDAMSATGPVAAVIVVDDSLSLQARAEDGGTILERGLEAAESLVSALPEGSRAAVLRASEIKAGAQAPPTVLGSPASARAVLARITPTQAHADLGDALRSALTLLHAAPLSERRLVLVTDLARHSLHDLSLPRWDDAADAPGTQGGRPRLQVIAPRREKGPNFSVSGLDAATLPGGRLRVTARVAAWGIDEREETSLDLQSGSVGEAARAVARVKVAVGPGASEERRFDIGAPPNGFGATVATLTDDILPADNSRACAHHLESRASVLIVDGDPQNLAIASETFYLEKALAPGVGLDVNADIIPLSELSPEVMADRAVLMLCNVRDLSGARAKALEDAVRAGSGLIVALGNRVDVEAYASSLARLLPARLGLPREAVPPASIQVDPAAHDDLPDLARVTVRQHVMLEPAEDARVLLRLHSGEALLVERAFGDGNVLLLGTTLDRDWTDLPISPSYLAFVREAIARASPRAESRVLPECMVGDAVDLTSLALTEPASVRAPDGSVSELPAGALSFANTALPGIHVVSAGDRVRGVFAVVTDPAESDLSRLSPDELEQALRGSVDGGSASAGGASDTGGWPAWQALLALLVIACAAESWLARRSA